MYSRCYWAAATLGDDGEPQLTGSRALAIVGIGADLEAAERRAAHAAAQVKATTAATGGEVRYRHDIGTKALVDQRIEHMRSIRRLPV